MAKKLFTSPKGMAVWPHLNAPDTKFKDEGEYHVKLRVPVAEAQDTTKLIDTKMKESLTQARDEAMKKAETPKEKKAAAAIEMCKDKPYSLEKDDDDEETGNVLFSFKMKASGVTKKTKEPWTQRPAVFNATLDVVTDKNLKIGGGSTLRISYEIIPFWTAKLGAGVSLRMKGVQVIKLVEWGQGDAKQHGFAAEGDEESSMPDTSDNTDLDGGAAEPEDDDF